MTKTIRILLVCLAGALTLVAAGAAASPTPKPLPSVTVPAGCMPGSQADILVNRAMNVRGHLTRARLKLPSGYEIEVTPDTDSVVVAIVGVRDAEILYVCYSAS